MKKLLFVHATLIVALAGIGCASESNSQNRSEYVGQEDREIKSLSNEDIEELRTGKGWGLAKAAELNGMPGPVHLLQMKDEIDLSDEQLPRIEQLYDDMTNQAIPLGKELIELERSLDEAFATGSIDEEKLAGLVEEIGRVYGELRYVHLAAHLKTRDILTHAQMTQYNRLRGYSSKNPCDNVPEGHDPEMWRRHNDCAPDSER